MDFSLDWIRQYVDLPSDVGTEAIASRLTGAGLAIEGEEAAADGGTVFDIDVTTNRPDCMNHYGLARELSVLFDVPLRARDHEIGGHEIGDHPSDNADSPARSDEAAADAVSIRIATAGCARFAATVVRGVTVGPSPEWLVGRLESVGVRAINNVVDATNYILWAFGQPIHAYDLAKVAGATLEAREARDGESVTTLDDQERKLVAGQLIIADTEGPSGLAGVMGGADSEVREATVDVVLEAAHFDPVSVRKTARAHGLKTDASHRFERGADVTFCADAARLAARLVQSLAGGTVLAGVVDVEGGVDGASRAEPPPPVTIEHARLERFGGIELPSAEVERILGGLGFDLAPSSAGGAWAVSVPGWRRYDFENAYPADVYEEVLRIIGFDAIPATLPAIGPPDAPESVEHRRRRTIQDHLAASGFAETIAWAFLDGDRAERYPSLLGTAPAVAVANPLSDRYSVMRRSLLPTLVEAARFNLRRGAEAVRLFEVGHVFAPAGTGHPFAMPNVPVTELETVAGIIGGRLGSPWQRAVDLDFFDLKGAVEHLATVCGSEVVMRPATLPKLLDGTSAEVVRAADPDTVIGVIGQLESDDDPVDLFVFELATAGLGDSGHPGEVVAPPRLPGIDVATTITHDVDVAWRAIATAIDQAEVEDLARFELTDRYAGEGVPEGAVNTTIDFVYNAGDRSLTQDEVNERHTKLTALLEDRFGWR